MGQSNPQQDSYLQRGWNDLMTYARQGLRELRSVIYPESPHARETDPGMWGNKLPMEVYQERHGEVTAAGPGMDPMNQLKSLESHLQATPNPAPAKEERNKGLERD